MLYYVKLIGFRYFTDIAYNKGTIYATKKMPNFEILK